MSDRRPRGRPAHTPDQARRHSLKITVTDAERDQLQAAAESRGLSIASYLRSLAFSSKPRKRRV